MNDTIVQTRDKLRRLLDWLDEKGLPHETGVRVSPKHGFLSVSALDGADLVGVLVAAAGHVTELVATSYDDAHSVHVLLNLPGIGEVSSCLNGLLFPGLPEQFDGSIPISVEDVRASRLPGGDR